MRRFSGNKKSNKGVSAIIGVLVLVLLVLVLSAGVLFTANNMLGEQPTDMTAGTTTERITDYEYQTQLVSQGNAQTVEVVSPLGTHYKLTQVGDATRILAVAPNGNESQVRDMRVVGLEQKTDERVDNEDAVQKTGEQQVLERKPVKDGIDADVIVDKYGTGDYKSIQTAINTIDSAVDRPITKDNPAVIVVERAVYKENIDVSQNISLIAEHGTIIEDSEPNENVVDVAGDNTEFRNFDIDADPVPNDNHYGLHGINIEGESAEVVGNHVYNSSSPDLTSAGVNVAGTASILKFNSVENNQRSLQFDDGAKYPFVCGNQLDNTISGQLSQKNINEVTKDNYWKEGVPVSLIPEETENNTQLSKVRQRILEANNKIPVNEIPADVGRAGQPFPGTKLQAGELSGCDLTISFTNNFNTSFNIENIEVQIEGRNTTLEVVARDEVTYETGDGANRRSQTEAQVVCYCGGDNEWDRNDTFELDPIEANVSTNPVETAQAVNIINRGSGSTGGGGGGGGGGGASPPEASEKCTETTTEGDAVIHGDCFDYDTERKKTTQETDTTEETTETQTFQIILGKTVEVQLADKVTISAAVSGAQGEVGYEWSLGDGTNKSGEQVTHLYNDSGTYDVCLYAWDKATNESDSDCTTATVEEGTKDLEKIRQEEKEKLQDRIDEAKEDKVIYLEEGEYDSLNIKVPGLTVIGNGDVDIQQSAKVTAEDVTVKNIDFENGLSVYQDGFKLWNSEVYNSGGYAMEVDADGNKFLYIGNSQLNGNNGLLVNADSDTTIQNNSITASGKYGLKLGSRMDGIRVTENTITSNEYGIHRGHATTMYLENNDITAPNRVYRTQNQPPTISNINPDVSLAHLPASFGANFKEPEGDRIISTKWSLNSDTATLSPSSSFVTTVDETGEHTVQVQATDKFGATNSVQKNFTFEEPSISVQSPSLVSEKDDITISVDTNVPAYRINYVTYKWGDGSQIKTGSLSRTTQYDSVGNYTATVVLGTDSGFTIEKQTQINVTDSPVANYYANPSGEQFYVGEPIEFDASPSTAPDGRSLTYEWDFDNDGVVEKTGEQVSHTYTSFAEHKPTLTVKDDDGFTESVTKRVRLNKLNMSVSVSNAGVDTVTEVSVDTSLDSEITEYRVAWGPESKAYNSEPLTYTYTSKGEYDITVGVSVNGNSYGEGTAVSKTITVQDSPDFDIYSNTRTVNIGETIDFDVVNLSVNNPTIRWEFGDGTVSTSKSPSHTFAGAGVYTVAVTVEDDDGISKTKEVEVVVGSEKIYEWEVAQVVDSTGLANPSERPASKSVDGDTNSYTVLDETQDGQVEYSSGRAWTEMRFYSTTSSEITVTLGDGTVLNEDWSSSSGWNVVNLSSVTDGKITATTKNVRIQLSDNTDKRLNEVEFKKQSFDFDITRSIEKPVVGDEITFGVEDISYVSGAMYKWDFNNDGKIEATGKTVTHSYESAGVYDVSIRVDTDNKGSKTKVMSVGVTEPETGLYSTSFEDGLTEWNRLSYGDSSSSFKTVDAFSVEGDYSMFMRQVNDNDRSKKLLATNTVFENGERPGRFVYYWMESECSHSGGIRLRNSAGNEEVAFYTDNPGWKMHDGNGHYQIYGGDGYHRWVKVEMVFDWESNSYTYTIEDLQSGTVKSSTSQLKEGVDVRTIEIYQDRDSWDTYMWFDNIRFTSKGVQEDISSTDSYSGRKAC